MRGKNLFIQFIVGLIMFVVGLFWLFQRVHVSMGFGGFSIYGFNVTGGLVLVPFIVGVVWLFINVDSVGAKVVTFLGLLIIVASIIMNIHFTMYSVTLYEFLIIMVFIAGGLGLLIKTIFGMRNHEDNINKIMEENKRYKEKIDSMEKKEK